MSSGNNESHANSFRQAQTPILQDLDDISSFVGLVLGEEKAIFDNIWYNIYEKSEGGSVEIVTLNSLRNLQRRLEKAPQAATEAYKDLGRIINLLSGPVLVFSEIPALFTKLNRQCQSSPDFDEFIRKNDYLEEAEGYDDDRATIAINSVRTLSNAIRLLNNPLLKEAGLDCHCREIFTNLSNRIVSSNVVSAFKVLKKNSVGIDR